MGRLLWRCALAMRRRFDEALRPLSLQARHFAMLIVLQQEGVISQQELAQRSGIDPSTAVALLDELEKLRLVERRQNPVDRRAHQLHLTAAGKKRLNRALSAATAVDNAMLAPLTLDERRLLKDLLRKVLSA